MDTTSSTAQIPSIRSNRGCWTCRLRRKKCDESWPGCSRCASVNLKCCYGPKPDWIGNVMLGKQELSRIKKIVGAAATRKRAAFRAKSQTSLKSQNSEDVESLPQSQYSAGTSEKDLILETRLSSTETLTEGSNSSRNDSQLKWLEDHEASLMMHYLDHVFFVQFRFYTPSISTGGRGWLLSLLTRTKPLYHAALSLSACLSQEGGEARTDYLPELERHHNLTLQELQLFIQAYSEHTSTAFGGNVQILACMVQLISFELFNGSATAWQIHLRAAAELVVLLHGLSAEDKSETPSSVYEINSSLDLDSYLSTTNFQASPDGARTFFTGAIIWFDALACLSTGLRPYLFNHYSRLLRPCMENIPARGPMTGTIELQSIMGCQNWAIMAIGEIAELRAWKEDQIATGNLDIHQVVETARKIELSLQCNHSEIRNEIDFIRSKHSGPPPYHCTELYNTYTTLVVTRTFACAALIYLQTVTSSDPSILNISTALRDVMSAMGQIPDPRMFRGLVWPLCVAGCMASSQAHQQFFRESLMYAISDSPRFGNSGQAMRILENSWEMQRERGRLVDCATVIRELGACILLV